MPTSIEASPPDFVASLPMPPEEETALCTGLLIAPSDSKPIEHRGVSTSNPTRAPTISYDSNAQLLRSDRRLRSTP